MLLLNTSIYVLCKSIPYIKSKFMNKSFHLASAIAFTALFSSCVKDTVKDKPNLLIIMTDEHSIRTLGCYRNYLADSQKTCGVNHSGLKPLISTGLRRKELYVLISTALHLFLLQPELLSRPDFTRHQQALQ